MDSERLTVILMMINLAVQELSWAKAHVTKDKLIELTLQYGKSAKLQEEEIEPVVDSIVEMYEVLNGS